MGWTMALERRTSTSPGMRAAGYGSGTVVLDDVGALDADHLMTAVRGLFASPNYHPPMLPQVAMEVHALTKRADVGLAAVVRLIERDAMLAAAVLRRAQSPAFATKIPPRSLGDAASRLGMNGLRDLVFEVAMAGRVFRSEAFGGAMDQIRRHSIRVAHAARLVAAETAIADDAVFLAGLLHDVGLVAGVHALTELARIGERIDLVTAAPVLRDVHLDAGVSLVRLWRLPEEVGWIVGAHHDPRIQGHVHPVAACIVLAEELAGGCVDLGAEPLGRTSAAAVAAAQGALRLDEAAIGRLAKVVASLSTD